MQTIGEEAPWLEPGPLLRHCSHDLADPASFYKPDLFHGTKSGMSKDLLASGLVACLDVVAGNNIESKISTINTALFAFAAREHLSLSLREITREMLGFDSHKVYPKGAWSKGSDSTIIAKFIVDFLGADATRTQTPLLRHVLECAQVLNLFLSFLYGCGVWMTNQEARTARDAGYAFLMTYMSCAQDALLASRFDYLRFSVVCLKFCM